MTCEPYRESLSELLDGALTETRRAELETHLSSCPDCRTLADDLRRIREAAGSLEPLTPPDRVWDRLARQLRMPAAPAPTAARGDARRTPALPFGRRGWLAAAATLAIAAGLAFWTMRAPEAPTARRAAGPSGSAAGDTVAATVDSVEAELDAAEAHYTNAIAGLEQIANAEQDVLDPEIADSLQQDMALLDGAIAESRAALRGEPASAPARDSLFEALKRKVALLQDTIALMNEMRKGNEIGAGRVVDELNKS